MAQSYEQLQKKIKLLQQQAAKMREKEVEGVVERIKAAIAHYELTPRQLFGDDSANERSRTKEKSARYRDEKGNTWSGMGKRPNWLRQALGQGRTLEEFRIDSGTVASRPAKRASSNRRTAKASYRDEAGNTWSGFGPRPKWLKDAIAAGRSEESLRV